MQINTHVVIVRSLLFYIDAMVTNTFDEKKRTVRTIESTDYRYEQVDASLTIEQLVFFRIVTLRLVELFSSSFVF
jgi:hypothetical protein